MGDLDGGSHIVNNKNEGILPITELILITFQLHFGIPTIEFRTGELMASLFD